MIVLMAVFWCEIACLRAADDISRKGSSRAVQPQEIVNGIKDGFIFPPQDKHVHSSSIVELPDGDLLTCWYHGSGERRANDVVIQGAVLRRGAANWSSVFLMADTPRLPDCNPVLFVDAKQRIWLFWIVPLANRWEHSVLKYRRADTLDSEGRPNWSWQDSIHLVPREDFSKSVEAGFKKMKLREGLWAEYAFPYSRMLIEAARDPIKRQTGWMPRIHPITLPSGRILLPLYSDGFNISLMAISDDDGESWRSSAPIIGLGPIQPSVARKQDGGLIAYMRDSGGTPGRVQQSTSVDNGETWSIAIDTDIPNPGASIETVVLQDGRWVMVYNDTERGRHRLSLALSDDEGKTWKWKRTMEHDSERTTSFSYPSLIQSRDGRLHLTYSHSGSAGASIKHVSVAVAWILHGES